MPGPVAQGFNPAKAGCDTASFSGMTTDDRDPTLVTRLRIPQTKTCTPKPLQTYKPLLPTRTSQHATRKPLNAHALLLTALPQIPIFALKAELHYGSASMVV